MFAGLGRFFICAVLSFLLLPVSQVMGAWSCEYLPEPTITEDSDSLFYEIRLKNIPNDLAMFTLKVDFDPTQLEVAYDQIPPVVGPKVYRIDTTGCLTPNLLAQVLVDNQLTLTGFPTPPIAAGSYGCVCTVEFAKLP